MRAGDDFVGGLHCGFETESLFDEAQIVVDGLGNADDADGKLAARDLVGYRLGPAQGSVAPDTEQQVDLHRLQGVDHGAGILVAARRAQNGSAALVNLIHQRRCQVHRGVAVFGHQALISVPEALDRRDVVVMKEHRHQTLDDVVEAGAQAAAGDDAGPRVRGAMEELRARAGFLEGRECFGSLLERADVLDLAGKGDLVLIVDEAAPPQGRNLGTGPRDSHGKVALVGVSQDVFVDHFSLQ